MKKWLAVFVLMLAFLSACKEPAQLPPQGPVTPPLPAAPGILDGKTAAEGALFSLDNAYIQQGVQQNLRLFGEQLLVSGAQYREDGSMVNKIALLSLSSGEVVQEKELHFFGDLQICGDTVVLTDFSAGTAVFLDETLAETKRVETGIPGGMIAVDPACTKLYCVTAQQGLHVLDLQTQEKTVLLPQAVNLYGSELQGNALSLTYTDKDTQLHQSAVLNVETGGIMPLPFEGVFYGAQWTEGYWLCGVYGENGTYFLGRDTRPYSVTLTEKYSSAFFLRDPARILVKSQSGENMVLSLYAIDGTFLSKVSVAGSPTDFVWSEAGGGYIFLYTDRSGRDRLMFWDLGVPVAGTPLMLTPAHSAPQQGTAVSEALYTRAENLSETYGVKIRIAEQIDAGYRDFTAVTELDETLISMGLDALEEVFAKFPKNFLPQLRYGTQQSLEIHLAGAIGRRETPETVSGFTSFSGFAENRATHTVVTLDLTRPGTLAQTFCHELVHVMEGKMAFDASLRKDALYSEESWQTLNPAGFAYAETYNEMPMEYFTDGLDAYFIDLYSRTYAKEDRARILEHAMAGNAWIFSSPQRRAKLEYLCRCIRDCFDTEGWPEKTFWETAL